jgi:hypothetical protein
MNYTGPTIVQEGILRPVSGGHHDLAWLIKKVEALEKRVRDLEKR